MSTVTSSVVNKSGKTVAPKAVSRRRPAAAAARQPTSSQPQPTPPSTQDTEDPAPSAALVQPETQNATSATTVQPTPPPPPSAPSAAAPAQQSIPEQPQIDTDEVTHQHEPELEQSTRLPLSSPPTQQTQQSQPQPDPQSSPEVLRPSEAQTDTSKRASQAHVTDTAERTAIHPGSQNTSTQPEPELPLPTQSSEQERTARVRFTTPSQNNQAVGRASQDEHQEPPTSPLFVLNEKPRSSPAPTQASPGPTPSQDDTGTAPPVRRRPTPPRPSVAGIKRKRGAAPQVRSAQQEPSTIEAAAATAGEDSTPQAALGNPIAEPQAASAQEATEIAVPEKTTEVHVSPARKRPQKRQKKITAGPSEPVTEPQANGVDGHTSESASTARLKPRASRKPRAKKTAAAAAATEAGEEATEDGSVQPAPRQRKRKALSAARVAEDDDGEGPALHDGDEGIADAAGKPASKKRQRKKAPPKGTGEEGGEEQADGVEYEPEEEIEDPESYEIDANKVTMYELSAKERNLGKTSERETKMAAINWAEVIRKRKEAANAIATGMTAENLEEDGNNGGQQEDGEPTPAATGAPITTGPQLRLDQHGNIVVEESSLQIDRAAQATRDAVEADEDNDLTVRINRSTWINDRRRDPTDRVPMWKSKSDPWSEEETDRFYDALSMWGTDFYLISKLFVPKTRRQIKLKFTREERLDPDRVNRALNGEIVPMDLQHFAAATGREVSDFKDPRELDEELAREGEEQRAEIEKKRVEYAEQQRQRDIQMQAREKEQNERDKQKKAQKAARDEARKRKRNGQIMGTGTF